MTDILLTDVQAGLSEGSAQVPQDRVRSPRVHILFRPGRPAAPRLCGGRGQQGPAAHLPAATTLRTSSPQEAPHRRHSPSENKRPAPWGLTIRPRPAMKKGVGCQLCGRPSSSKDSSQPQTPQAPPNTVWESQAAAGARAAGGGDLPPPPPAWNPGASHSHARDKGLNTDPEAHPWGPPISPARGQLA